MMSAVVVVENLVMLWVFFFEISMASKKLVIGSESEIQVFPFWNGFVKHLGLEPLVCFDDLFA